MSIQNLSDTELIAATDLAVKQERSALMRVLEHLKEIERRRLYCDYKQESLCSMLMSRWGYSSDEACRRIDAIRLLRELPEIESKITEGKVSLTHLNMAQTMFKKEKRIAKNPLSKAQKFEVIERISGQSTRAAQKILIQASSVPHALKRDRIFLVSETEIGLEFRARPELEEKIKVLKGLLAHQNPDLSIGDLFEKLCDLGIEAWDPSRTKKEKRLAAPTLVKREIADQSIATVITRETAPARSTDESKTKLPAAPRVTGSTNAVAKAKSDDKSLGPHQIPSRSGVRRQVFKGAQNKCTNCESTFAPEVDHVMGRALGGSNEIENLRLLCRSCNQRAAIRAYGLKKMSRYTDPREPSRRYVAS